MLNPLCGFGRAKAFDVSSRGKGAAAVGPQKICA
jgi:hypothetical protein